MVFILSIIAIIFVYFVIGGIIAYFIDEDLGAIICIFWPVVLFVGTASFVGYSIGEYLENWKEQLSNKKEK